MRGVGFDYQWPHTFTLKPAMHIDSEILYMEILYMFFGSLILVGKRPGIGKLIFV